MFCFGPATRRITGKPPIPGIRAVPNRAGLSDARPHALLDAPSMRGTAGKTLRLRDAGIPLKSPHSPADDTSETGKLRRRTARMTGTPPCHRSVFKPREERFERERFDVFRGTPDSSLHDRLGLQSARCGRHDRWTRLFPHDSGDRLLQERTARARSHRCLCTPGSGIGDDRVPCLRLGVHVQDPPRGPFR